MKPLLRTSIGLHLRVIPPSAGLSRKTNYVLHKVSRHIPQQSRKYLNVIRDEELDAEIKAYKEANAVVERLWS